MHRAIETHNSLGDKRIALAIENYSPSAGMENLNRPEHRLINTCLNCSYMFRCELVGSEDFCSKGTVCIICFLMVGIVCVVNANKSVFSLSRLSHLLQTSGQQTAQEIQEDRSSCSSKG